MWILYEAIQRLELETIKTKSGSQFRYVLNSFTTQILYKKPAWQQLRTETDWLPVVV
jgi:hypothetical protein